MSGILRKLARPGSPTTYVATAHPGDEMLSGGTFPMSGEAHKIQEGEVFLRVLGSYGMPVSSAIPSSRVVLWDGASQCAAVLSCKLPVGSMICMRAWKIVTQYSGTNLELLKAEALQTRKIP